MDLGIHGKEERITLGEFKWNRHNLTFPFPTFFSWLYPDAEKKNFCHFSPWKTQILMIKKQNDYFNYGTLCPFYQLLWVQNVFNFYFFENLKEGFCLRGPHTWYSQSEVLCSRRCRIWGQQSHLPQIGRTRNLGRAQAPVSAQKLSEAQHCSPDQPNTEEGSAEWCLTWEYDSM